MFATSNPVVSRLSAAVIAVSAWLGLFIELRAVLANGFDLPVALWTIFAYFTIITNLLVALLFSHIAVVGPRADHGWYVAGVALSIALVGVVFALLLQGLRELSGAGIVGDFLLRRLNPLLVPLFWLFLVSKNTLAFRAPFQWAVFPLLYFVYAIARGLSEGRYAYPFLDVAALGWARVAVNAIGIAIGYLIAGTMMVWLDRRLGKAARIS